MVLATLESGWSVGLLNGAQGSHFRGFTQPVWLNYSRLEAEDVETASATLVGLGTSRTWGAHLALRTDWR